MTLDEFRASLTEDAPPEGSSPALAALWYDANSDWHRAHTILQDDEGADGAWAHAYLHRVEGDLPNAGYWYRRANRAPSGAPLEEEWSAIAQELLARS
ncbi:MAG: hypothetical protein WDZ49_00730 [Litorilinea sp.]